MSRSAPLACHAAIVFSMYAYDGKKATTPSGTVAHSWISSVP